MRQPIFSVGDLDLMSLESTTLRDLPFPGGTGTIGLPGECTTELPPMLAGRGLKVGPVDALRSSELAGRRRLVSGGLGIVPVVPSGCLAIGSKTRKADGTWILLVLIPSLPGVRRSGLHMMLSPPDCTALESARRANISSCCCNRSCDRYALAVTYLSRPNLPSISFSGTGIVRSAKSGWAKLILPNVTFLYGMRITPS